MLILTGRVLGSRFTQYFPRRNLYRDFVHLMTRASIDSQDQYPFGQWVVDKEEVFARSAHSFAFVNLKPILPGHVLISPLRVVPRYQDLTPAEIGDMWTLAQRVGRMVEAHYGATGLTMAIQDGASAGQTVFHVHIHILPRKEGDFERNDQVYDELEKHDKELYGDHKEHTGISKALDDERKPRTKEQMSAEAAVLRQRMRSLESD